MDVSTRAIIHTEATSVVGLHYAHAETGPYHILTQERKTCHQIFFLNNKKKTH